MDGSHTQVEQRPRRHDAVSGGGSGSPASPEPRRHWARYRYDPQGHVRAGRLRLARAWMEAGGIDQAIQAYADMLDCCGGTYAADAAVEDLLDLAHVLEQRGQFYAALAIFRRVEGSYQG
jgi:hypothetical protein